MPTKKCENCNELMLEEYNICPRCRNYIIPKDVIEDEEPLNYDI